MEVIFLVAVNTKLLLNEWFYVQLSLFGIVENQIQFFGIWFSGGNGEGHEDYLLADLQ